MKKIVISTIIATTLVTNIMAEITPYIDLGYDSFTILTNDTADINKTTCASAISTEKTSDGNSTVGLNGGMILNDNSNIATTSTNDINKTTNTGDSTEGLNGGAILKDNSNITTASINDSADRNKTTCASAISTEKTSDGNSTAGLNGGVILNGSSNITTTSTNDINKTTSAGGSTLGSNGGVIINDNSNIATTPTNDINITTGASAILTEEISDGGYTLGSNGGVIINDNSNIATTLATNMMAEVKLYIGLGYNGFIIYTKDGVDRNKITGDTTNDLTEKTGDSGSTVGLNGGVILSDNSKINFSYFSGKEKDSELLKTTVMAISYDYSFNNIGVRKGWYLGAGFSSVETEIENDPLRTSTFASGTGLLLRVGYEYQMNNNILFDFGINIHASEQKLIYDYKTNNNIEGSRSASVRNFNISVNYIF